MPKKSVRDEETNSKWQPILLLGCQAEVDIRGWHVPHRLRAADRPTNHGETGGA
jgi:hypothetical protein